MDSLILLFQFNLIIHPSQLTVEPIANWLNEPISLATPGEKIKRLTTMKILLDYIQEDF